MLLNPKGFDKSTRLSSDKEGLHSSKIFILISGFLDQPMIYSLLSALVIPIASLRLHSPATCPTVIDIPNSTHKFTSARTVEYTCRDGYTFKTISSNKYTTDCDLTSQAPSCEKVQCRVYSLPDNVAAADSVVNTVLQFDDELKLPCKSGFTGDGIPVGPSSIKIKCGHDGQMVPSSLFLDSCKPVSCGRAPQLQFTKATDLPLNLPPRNLSLLEDDGEPSGSASFEPVAQAGSHTFGDTVNYACIGNYTLDASPKGQNKFNIFCGADGKYTEAPECQLVTCGALPVYTNAEAMDSKPPQLGSSMQYSCVKGTTVRASPGTQLTAFTISCAWNPLTQMPYYTQPTNQCALPA